MFTTGFRVKRKLLVGAWIGNHSRCWSTTNVPRIPGTDTSAMYMGTIIVNIPTANPAIALPGFQDQQSNRMIDREERNIPTKIIAVDTAPAWIAEPITKTTTATCIDQRRPKRSARGPLTRDPNHAATQSLLISQHSMTQQRIWCRKG